MEAFSFFLPTRVYFGAETWQASLKSEAAHLQGNVMVVSTGRSLVRLGYLPALVRELEALRGGRPVVVYDQVSANPKLHEVEEAVRIGKDAHVDTVLGFGGGSAMDAAKATAAGIGSPHSVRDLLLQGIAPSPETPRIYAVPTTAGTGSELSRGAILSSPEDGVKTGIRGEAIAPAVAIVDSSFTWHVPPRTTVETGFDVFAHAMERYVSKKSNEVSRMFSERALALVGTHLPRLMTTPDDHDARDAMSYASLLMGSNLANVGTALPHRMQYPVGAQTDTSHGAGLLALYPAWLRHEYAVSATRVERAMTLLAGHPCDGRAACEAAFLAFVERIGGRHGLHALGVTSEPSTLAAKVTGAIERDPAAAEPDILRRIYAESMD